ncbi:MFS transporter [Sphingomonas sp. J315]|uniref:MFS transporter n=1 Tax=Sphingomonas sp. J315 TaxID=2898433 RepID=UPI0021AE0023|nr:MFS transporter [Sphingomonas sp. J315]UUY00486.1 MFS transporter [Sphingomonas sp. J315]
MLLYVDRVVISAAKEQITGELVLSDTQFGWVISAFALGYALFQVPSGQLADRIGPRKTLAAIVIIWSGFTALTGAAWGFLSLLLFRFLFGAAEAGAMPACAKAVYSWLPTAERGIANGINLSGTRVGAALALPGLAWMLSTFGWRQTFVIMGAVGLLWVIAWYALFRDRPEDHWGMPEAEVQQIIAGRTLSTPKADTSKQGASRQGGLWLVVTQYFASCFTFFFALSWLFPYLQKTYGLTTVETGFMTAIPLAAGAAGNWLGGVGSDFAVRRTGSIASLRYVAMLGFALAAIGLVGSLNADTAIVAVLFLSLTVFGADMTLPPSWAFCIDVGGERAGTVTGQMNMVGAFGAFATGLAFPYLYSAFNSVTPFFLTAVALNLGAATLWAFVPRAKRAEPTDSTSPA